MSSASNEPREVSRSMRADASSRRMAKRMVAPQYTIAATAAARKRRMLAEGTASTRLTGSIAKAAASAWPAARRPLGSSTVSMRKPARAYWLR